MRYIIEEYDLRTIFTGIEYDLHEQKSPISPTADSQLIIQQ